MVGLTDASCTRHTVCSESSAALYVAVATCCLSLTLFCTVFPRPPAGVGLDFNTELVESISKVKGANYFSVHTPGEFKRRLVDQFDFAVR